MYIISPFLKHNNHKKSPIVRRSVAKEDIYLHNNLSNFIYFLSPGRDLSSGSFAGRLLSALRRFTSLFGMGKGGATSLKRPRLKKQIILFYI